MGDPRAETRAARALACSRLAAVRLPQRPSPERLRGGVGRVAMITPPTAISRQFVETTVGGRLIALPVVDSGSANNPPDLIAPFKAINVATSDRQIHPAGAGVEGRRRRISKPVVGGEIGLHIGEIALDRDRHVTQLVMRGHTAGQDVPRTVDKVRRRPNKTVIVPRIWVEAAGQERAIKTINGLTIARQNFLYRVKVQQLAQVVGHGRSPLRSGAPDGRSPHAGELSSCPKPAQHRAPGCAL